MSLNNSFIYLPKSWPKESDSENPKDFVFHWIINFSLIFSSISLFSLMISYPLLVINVQSYNKNIQESMTECAESLIELENYVAQFSTDYYLQKLQKLNRTIRSNNKNEIKPRKCCIKGIPGSPGKNGKNGIPGSNGFNGLPGRPASISSLWNQCINCKKRFELHAVLRDDEMADTKHDTQNSSNNTGIRRSPKVPFKGRKWLQKHIKNLVKQ